MEQDKIIQLLERYWQCETSLEDERLLRDFFAGDSVPKEWRAYQPLFVWKDKQKTIQGTPVHPTTSKRPAMYFYPILKIAASVLIVLTFGISVYTHFQQEKFMDRMFSESALNALDTKKDSVDAMAKASLRLAPEEDSLRITDRHPSPLESQKE
ncbi:MAG: hypothetical protein LBH19_10610 [Dysgonamonadaceae bacterium]|jgi:hypothetical protein|nr:hypothetical protein [Dysgonamonadaceae bacterium]